MLINPELSIEDLVGKYTAQAYPQSKALLASYYCNLENRIQPGRRLQIYAGVQEAEKSFLPTAEFVKFYNELSTLTDEVKGNERKKLHMLRTALAFTRLELGRIHSFAPHGYALRKGEKIETIPEAGDWLNRLSEHEAFPEMRYYNEASDEINDYCKEWKQYIAQPTNSPNLLLGERLTAGSKLDENYTNLAILTDGTRGLPGSYHFGWFISSSGDLILNLPKKAADRAGKLCIRFLHLPKHRIYAPQSIELLKDGEFYKKLPNLPISTSERGEITESCTPVELKSNQQLTLRIKRADKKKAQIAIDEVSFIPQK